MKMNLYDQKNLKEEVLTDVVPVNNAPEIDEEPPKEIPQRALDDARRIKVLSPSRLVAKRFFRNKLAMAGLVILIAMFLLCFVGGWVGRYGQKEVFYKYDNIMFSFGTANERTTYEGYYVIDASEINNLERNKLNSYISEMRSKQQDTRNYTDSEGNAYTLTKLDENLYEYRFHKIQKTATYDNKIEIGQYHENINGEESELILDGPYSSLITDNTFKNLVKANIPGRFVYEGNTYIILKSNKIPTIYIAGDDGKLIGEDQSDGFKTVVKNNLSANGFTYEGKDFIIEFIASNGIYQISRDYGNRLAAYLSTYVFDMQEAGFLVDTEFKTSAFGAVYGSGTFEWKGKTYRIMKNEKDIIVIQDISNAEPVDFANFSTFVVRRYNGEDTLSISFKDQLQEKVKDMIANGETLSQFTFYMQQIDGEGNLIFNEEGEPVFDTSVFVVERKLDNFVLTNLQNKYLINIFDKPSSEHWMGTDGSGMDVFTRLMYGGRISLIIGFVVVFLEVILGVILGGIAGYFGKWVDQLIMRIVDIFYCVPTLPILIILGAFFDSVRMDSYMRIMYMMIVLGILGWPGVARMVRGQILSLREQEFMIATEAAGLKASRRIFKHLIPNVMPQLIVIATMGLGGVILTESTLSFLGLGAKYPLATWGAMINSVSSSSAMVNYTYIWIPVGLMICLTVIAFNFVGDGLRDAFDPKMKR
jgi:peptide/nickel transport system permease protein